MFWIFKTKPDWTSLPDDMIAAIAERLHSRIDVLRFRAVCRRFRSKAPLPLHSRYPYPNIKLPFIKKIPKPEHGCLSTITQSIVYVVEPLKNGCLFWRKPMKPLVVRVEELEHGVSVIKKPLREDYLEEPSTKSLKPLNLFDFRVTEVSRVYEVQYTEGELRSAKVVVSDEICDGKISFMAKLDSGKSIFWKIGEETWKKIDANFHVHAGDGLYFQDIIHHNHKFYAVNSEGEILTVDLKTSEVGLTGGIPSYVLTFFHYKYFAKSNDDLFLVTYSNNLQCESLHNLFHIYKLDEMKLKWVPVMADELQEKVFLLGKQCSFCVSSKDFPRFKSVNCFGTPRHRNGCESRDNVFWPPPNWVRVDSC